MHFAFCYIVRCLLTTLEFLDQVFRKPEKLHLNSGYSKWGILCKNVRH
jgi:hypothetical protein